MPQTDVIIEICTILLFTLYNSKNIAHHITEELIFYADKIMVWAIPKIRVYLISRFYSRRENRENVMLAKYTCFTVVTHTIIMHAESQIAYVCGVIGHKSVFVINNLLCFYSLH